LSCNRKRGSCDAGFKLKVCKLREVALCDNIVRNAVLGLCWLATLGLEDANGRPTTVNTERDIELMRRKFILVLRRKLGVDMDTVIY